MPEICLIPPAGEPLHIAEAKLDRRITDAVDDSRLRSLIAAARQHAEMQTRQQLLHARWQLTLDGFPCGESFGGTIVLPHSPLVKVVSIQYLDMAGVLQTMPDTDYVVNKANMPGLVAPPFGKIWPIALPQIGAVTVTYDAGYASPFKATSGTGNIKVSGPFAWSVGDRVQFYGSGDDTYALPAPLDQDASYLIASAAGNGVYTLTDAAGAAIVFTDAGAGNGRGFIGVVPDGIRSWMLLRVGALYENKEEAAVGQRVVVLELPYVSGLLDPYRTSMP
jgi:uncharacterized phiE125 gp8 family phage protein